MTGRSLIIIFLISLVAGVAVAWPRPDPPDLSGTWVLEYVGTVPLGDGTPLDTQRGSDEAERGGNLVLPDGVAAMAKGETITIVQTPDRVTVTTGTGRSTSYVLERPFQRTPGSGSHGLTARARWHGGALVAEAALSRQADEKSAPVKVRETFSLLDPETLTIEVTTETPDGPQTHMLVFGKETDDAGDWNLQERLA